MKKFMNLLNDELKRAKWLYLILVIAVILTQSLVIFRQFRQANYYFMNQRDAFYMLTLADIFKQTPLFFLIIGVAALSLILYSMFTWVREWHFQGNYIYRLLMLPGSRMPIFMAKFVSILLMIVGLWMTQLFILFATDWIGNLLPHLYHSSSVVQVLMQHLDGFQVVMSMHFQSFIFIYLFGFNFLIGLMNITIIVLSYRSYHLIQTILLPLLYLFFSWGISALIIQFASAINFTSFEFNIVAMTLLVIAMVIQLSISYYIMNHYISV
ncbi:hypothetical protein CYJ57_06990 [Falseniella ignava]|uniref:Uncharacterized protein n=1 Tax=Falseniella ignava TaxID=137730 RepID=A0A2I1JW12_9LACT|nr:hypothetical protein [Falseniella ignava]PKY87584.1 hypothetical protein CYJ57_06990 [Falseniella ignava]